MVQIVNEEVKIPYPIVCGMCHKATAKYLVSKPERTDKFWQRCATCKEKMLAHYRLEENTAIIRSAPKPVRQRMAQRKVTVVKILN